jgi:hypothetical protein
MTAAPQTSTSNDVSRMDRNVATRVLPFKKGLLVSDSIGVYEIVASGCWLWTGGKDTTGYGRKSVKGRLQPAHRVFYEAARGPIPSGLVLDHLCRVKLCVNPDHLEPVKQVTNVRRGTSVKITIEIAREIRARRSAARTDRSRIHGGLSYRELGAEYGVSDKVAGLICRGKLWLEVEASK